MENNHIAQTLINNILKKAFEDTNFKQIGKLPRFFDSSRSTVLDSQFGDLMAVPGFKASTYMSQNYSTILIDNLYKFMAQRNCRQTMVEIVDGLTDKEEK